MNAAPLAIRGWGSVCALGPDTRTAVQALREGRRGLGPMQRSVHVVPIPGDPLLVGEVPADLPLAHRARGVVDMAVDEALAMAGGGSAGTLGVFVGTTGGFFVEAEFDHYFARLADPDAHPAFARRGQGALADHVAERVGADGPVLTFAMACTSSAAALAAAGDHLRAGTCDRALVVGYDLLSSLTIHGFRSLMLYDRAPCRPFDATRAGLQLGEGCGALVIERGDGPFVLLGSGNNLDTAHLTASSSDGSTAARVIRSALARSGLTPHEVATIKAHGTGTFDNDLAEGRGIATVFGADAPPFASLKGSTGHTLGAAGALEVVLWLAALESGFTPGSVGFSTPDPEIGVAPSAVVGPRRRGAHLFNAFGFGGSCVSLVVADA